MEKNLSDAQITILNILELPCSAFDKERLEDLLEAEVKNIKKHAVENELPYNIRLKLVLLIVFLFISGKEINASLQDAWKPKDKDELNQIRQMLKIGNTIKQLTNNGFSSISDLYRGYVLYLLQSGQMKNFETIKRCIESERGRSKQRFVEASLYEIVMQKAEAIRKQEKDTRAVSSIALDIANNIFKILNLEMVDKRVIQARYSTYIQTNEKMHIIDSLVNEFKGLFFKRKIYES